MPHDSTNSDITTTGDAEREQQSASDLRLKLDAAQKRIEELETTLKAIGQTEMKPEILDELKKLQAIGFDEADALTLAVRNLAKLQNKKPAKAS